MKRLTLIDKAFILKASTLFTELDLELLLPIADKLTTLNCKTGETVFAYGETAHRLYLIVKGSIAIRNQMGEDLTVLEAQEFFGDEAIFGEQLRKYQAVCQKDTLLLALSHTHLLSIISESPNVALSLLYAYASTTSFRARKVTNIP